MPIRGQDWVPIDNMAISPVSTPNVPAAGGHYVQAIKHAGLVYVSGQLPVGADGSHHPEADFDTQARQAIRNLIAVTEAAGVSRKP